MARGRKAKGTYDPYEIYVKYYIQKRRTTRVEMSNIYGKEQFYTMYTALKADRQEEVSEGKRKQIGNVIRDLAADQQMYYFSRQQGLEVQRLYEDVTGKHLSLHRIRNYNPNYVAGSDGDSAEIDKNVFAMIKERYKELRDAGYNGTAAGERIGQTFFGSK